METSTQICSRPSTLWNNDWKLVNNMRSQTRGRAQRGEDTWHPPPHGYLKLNVDAAFPNQRHVTALGMCLRGEAGQVIMARTCWFPIRHGVKEGEALGLLEALNWAHHLQLHNVIFEMDSKSVVHSLHSNSTDITELRSIFRGV